MFEITINVTARFYLKPELTSVPKIHMTRTMIYRVELLNRLQNVNRCGRVILDLDNPPPLVRMMMMLDSTSVNPYQPRTTTRDKKRRLSGTIRSPETDYFVYW